MLAHQAFALRKRELGHAQLDVAQRDLGRERAPR